MLRFTAGVLCLVAMVVAMPGVRAAADGSGLPAPASLSLVPGNGSGPVAAGSWIDVRAPLFRFQVNVVEGQVTPQVEIEPFGVAFKNQPTVSGSSLSASGTAQVRAPALKDARTYHWQARVVDEAGLASPWTAFNATGGKPDFGVDLDPPTKPIVSSMTNPNQRHWYNSAVAALRWTSRDALSGIKGYSYVLARQAHAVPPGSTSAQTQLRTANLGNGIWVFSIRAVDRAGNWSPTAMFWLKFDRRPPRFQWLSPSRFSFNPYQGPTTVRFSLTKKARVQLGLYRVGSRAPVATYFFPHVKARQVVAITWPGKDSKGRPVPKGYYFFSATAIDHAKNVVHVNLGGIAVDPEQGVRTPSGEVLYPNGGKRIIVSLSRQTLYAYDGTHLALQTLVTTGNPALPTPPGVYSVLARYSPFEFISPWPPGSPYWYPPSWVQYALLFRQGGYFLHDAPWRSVFGPGSNGPGQPGSNYGGTHGCVNIPPGPMTFLWNWTPIGTRVDVIP